jgi:transposase-like protein
MPGAPKTTDELRQAITLREAGYSLAAIAHKTGISASTLSRHFKRHGASKGGLSDSAVDEARQQLMNDAGFINDLKNQIAAAIVDDISHVHQIREASALLLEQLMNDSSLPPHYKTRGLAALATSLRLTQEAWRKSLKVDELQPEPDNLPELCVYELTAAEIVQMRQEQAQDAIYDEPDYETMEVIDDS